MPTNSKNQKNPTSKKLNEIKYDTEAVNKILAENEALKKEVAALKAIKSRGDHEIIVDGTTYRINFNEMLKYFDLAASYSGKQPQYMGPQGTWSALARILGLITDEKDSEAYHAGNEKARTLLLQFRGAH